MATGEFNDDYIKFHKASIDLSRKSMVTNLHVGFAGAAMVGAGFIGEAVAFFENPYLAIPSTAALVLGGISVSESYKDYTDDLKVALDEQQKVTKAETLSPDKAG